jgi:hypothetical protein
VVGAVIRSAPVRAVFVRGVSVRTIVLDTVSRRVATAIEVRPKVLEVHRIEHRSGAYTADD